MDVRELSSTPGLLPLYGKAALGTVLPRGDQLPERRLALADVEIERAHLARYDEVCGFRVSDELPTTYPHVLAFPLTMALMTDRSFPFPLLGLVHVANRIEQRRPIRASERLALRVWAEDLRDHPKGVQLDVVAECRVDGEVAWLGRSTYLRRGAGTQRTGPSTARDERAEDALESTAEPSATLRVPGDIGRRYAAVSGDRNPIHMHSLAAKAFGFPGAIAHGMWMKARCLAALEGRLAPEFAVDAEFRSPLRIPGTARLATRARDGGWDFALRPAADGRPHVSGKVR